MSYTFVKLQQKPTVDGKQRTPYWMFKPKSTMDIMEHWNKYPRSVMSEGTKKLVAKFSKGHTGHFTNDFERVVEVYMSATGKDLVTSIVQMENEALNNRLNTFNTGHEIYLNHGMQVVLLDERFTDIVVTKESESLTFPDEEKPTLDDVRFLVWEGGKHTYAKIGKLDVVDADGNMKWNTRSEAEDAAKWYIEKYW